jgi:hypothetical protein
MAHRPGVDVQKLRDDAIASKITRSGRHFGGPRRDSAEAVDSISWVGRYVGDSQKGPEEFDECPRGLSAAPQEVRTSRRRHTD